jgi:hypothetical protein
VAGVRFVQTSFLDAAWISSIVNVLDTLQLTALVCCGRSGSTAP